MAEQAHDNKHWDARDFGRYHGGEMSADERHALEKATLDDPFLADALEGYALTKTPVQDIHELKARLEERHKISRTLWFSNKSFTRVLKIAAVLVLFLGLAWLLRINMSGDQAQEIASVKTVQPNPVNRPADSIERTLQDTAKTVTPIIPYNEIQKPSVVSSSSKVSVGEPDKETAGTDLVVVARQKDYADTTAAADLATAKAELQAVEKIDLFSREKAAAPPVILSKPIEAKVGGVVIRNQNPIRGRVVDNEGNPVAFANINDRQNNMILSADKDGYFSLNNRQNANNVKVDVNAVGFETNNTALNASTNENKIVLKESSPVLSEVVVTSSDVTKRSKMVRAVPPVKNAFQKNNEKLAFINIVPVAGWSQFNHYINDSLSTHPGYLITSADSTLRITFDLDAAGAPINIEFPKAAGDSAAAAGTRILKALPPMKKIKKEEKAGLIIRF